MNPLFIFVKRDRTFELQALSCRRCTSHTRVALFVTLRRYCVPLAYTLAYLSLPRPFSFRHPFVQFLGESFSRYHVRPPLSERTSFVPRIYVYRRFRRVLYPPPGSPLSGFRKPTASRKRGSLVAADKSVAGRKKLDFRRALSGELVVKHPRAVYSNDTIRSRLS